MFGWGALPPERAPDFFFYLSTQAICRYRILKIRMWILRILILKVIKKKEWASALRSRVRSFLVWHTQVR